MKGKWIYYEDDNSQTCGQVIDESSSGNIQIKVLVELFDKEKPIYPWIQDEMGYITQIESLPKNLKIYNTQEELIENHFWIFL